MNGVAVRPGRGDGTFADPIYTYFPFAFHLAAADFNDDGRLDIVTAASGSAASDFADVVYVSVLLGRGDGTFYVLETFNVGLFTPLGIGAGDIDNDGRPDVAISGIDLDGSYTVALGLNDGDWRPYISVSDATVTEGNTGAANATIGLNLSFASDVDVTVHYETADGDATAGSDYAAAAGNVTIPAGQTGATFTITVLGDSVPEPSETFFVRLTDVANARIANGVGRGTIVDDEPRVSISDVTKSEGRKGKTTLFTFTATLSAAFDEQVTMSYRTVNGTATTGNSDYVAKTGTLTFLPGEPLTKTITIEVKGDSKREASETFYLDLFGLSSNAKFTKNRGIGTILNDD